VEWLADTSGALLFANSFFPRCAPRSLLVCTHQLFAHTECDAARSECP
jgi:hypothetical protein